MTWWMALDGRTFSGHMYSILVTKLCTPEVNLRGWGVTRRVGARTNLTGMTSPSVAG